MKRFDAGVALKTAVLRRRVDWACRGWGTGLEIAKVYAELMAHSEELCAPYATVIDIDPTSCRSLRVMAGPARSHTSARGMSRATRPKY